MQQKTAVYTFKLIERGVFGNSGEFVAIYVKNVALVVVEGAVDGMFHQIRPEYLSGEGGPQPHCVFEWEHDQSCHHNGPHDAADGVETLHSKEEEASIVQQA